MSFSLLEHEAISHLSAPSATHMKFEDSQKNRKQNDNKNKPYKQQMKAIPKNTATPIIDRLIMSVGVLPVRDQVSLESPVRNPSRSGKLVRDPTECETPPATQVGHISAILVWSSLCSTKVNLIRTGLGLTPHLG